MYPQDAYVGNTCDTFVSYTIHLGYILGYTPGSGYIYNTSAIHVSYVLWCIATCIVRITNLTLGSSVSQMYLCAIHVSCMYCDVSSAIRRDTSRYVVLREKVPKSEGKGDPTPYESDFQLPLEIGPTAGGECSKRWVLVRFIIEVLG